MGGGLFYSFYAQTLQQFVIDMSLLDTNRLLRECCESWPALKPLAIDTEFERSVTYFARPALLQLSDGVRTELIDPLGIDEWSPLRAVLEDPSRIKILHSASEDIALLSRLCNVVPRAVFDTQIAYAFVCADEKSSYQHVVEQQLGRKVSKTESRSDWLKRPLSKAQLAYAHQDVQFLPALANKLQQALQDHDRSHWVEEECVRMIESVLEEQGGRQYTRLMPKADLSASQRELLYRLCVGRERMAASRNMPRRRVLSDETLLSFSYDIDPKLIERWRNGRLEAEELVDSSAVCGSTTARTRLIDALHAVCSASFASDSMPAALNKTQVLQYDKTIRGMRKLVVECAERLSLAPERIASRRMLESLIANAIAEKPRLPTAFRGWRKAVITSSLLARLKDLSIGDQLCVETD